MLHSHESHAGCPPVAGFFDLVPCVCEVQQGHRWQHQPFVPPRGWMPSCRCLRGFSPLRCAGLPPAAALRPLWLLCGMGDAAHSLTVVLNLPPPVTLLPPYLLFLQTFCKSNPFAAFTFRSHLHRPLLAALCHHRGTLGVTPAEVITHEGLPLRPLWTLVWPPAILAPSIASSTQLAHVSPAPPASPG